MKRKMVCLLLALTMAFAHTASAFAADSPATPTVVGGYVQNAPMPRYQNLFLILPSFSIVDRVASCALDVECFEKSTPVTATVILYRKTGSGKTLIDAWTIKDTGRITWDADVELSQTGLYIMAVTVSSGSDRYSDELTKSC